MDTVIVDLVARLHAAGDDRERIATALTRFIEAGLPVCGSPSALWEYLDKALRRAGYDPAERDRRTRIYSTVAHHRFGDGRPLPPDWPWHEREAAE
jgi:hypothetical protein